MQTKREEAFTIPKEISWHFERNKKPDDKMVENYVLIQPGAQDVAKVLKAYAHHPIPAYNIASIEIVYNEALNRQFLGNMQLMNKRKGNSKYVPTWKSTASGEEKVWREVTYRKLQDFSANHADPSMPHVMLLPLWHGTSDTVSDHILGGGYGIFSSNAPHVVTDDGYFGKGIYTAHEAEYAFRSYAQKHGDKAVLLLNWVSIYEAYPVIDGDMAKLRGKVGGYDQCDAHFIPVRSDLHPHTDIYVPCAQEQEASYHEIVVFTYQQCLPRYRVKLIQNAPQPPLDDTASLYYQRALDSLSLGHYEEVGNAFEEAAEAGHPGAFVRLHWWYSGGSGIYPSNPQALSKLQAVSTGSVNELKQKANFRGDNDAESQFTLGWCCEQGLGCEIQLAKAAQYYWIAATQGHSDAQYHLGVCCASGMGVKADISQAINYYEQAAKQRHIHAHYVLSQCYRLGLGVKANGEKAEYHQQAAQKGKHPQLDKMGTTAGFALAVNTEDKKTIEALKEAMAEKDKTITEKDQTLATKINEMEALKTELASTQKALQTLQDTELSLKIQLREYEKQNTNSNNNSNASKPSTPIPSVFGALNTPSVSTNNVPQVDPMAFKWVTEGHLDRLENCLLKTPGLAYVTNTFLDRSERTFRGMTLYQYALWALDFEACEMIEEYLDGTSALNQLNALENNPEQYSNYGPHYDITPLITKTQTI